MRPKCYQHEAVTWPPDDCIDCIRVAYGRDSDTYKEARVKKAIRMAGPRIRGLQQEDIDWVYGVCDMQDAVWCLAHQSRVTRRGRCDAWRDFEDSVERVIERLEQDPVVAHTFDEYRWPSFTVEPRPNADVRLHCSDCQWYKDFTGPAPWAVLTTATVRHGMGHQEEQR